MERRKNLIFTLLVSCVCALSGGSSATAEPINLMGQWYGQGEVPGLGGGIISVTFLESPNGVLAKTNIPILGLYDEYLPATIEEIEGKTTVTFGAPGLFEAFGNLDGDSISGTLSLVYGGETYTGIWYTEKYTGEPLPPDEPNGPVWDESILPGEAPGPVCEDLPPLYCTGSAEYCSELVNFEPRDGVGYLDYPINGESLEIQYRSFIRRDLMQLVKYATAKVDCKAADWEYGNFAQLGLGDMSEEDGSIPGTSVGFPGHPPETHEDGKDIDIAYYQLYAPDNRLRPVGEHYDGHFDAFHLTGPPYALDFWRTALFIAYLSEHPRVRIIGVDGKVGLVLDKALDELVLTGWINQELRNRIMLAYEVTDEGRGFYYHHHHHMHLSINPVHPGLLISAELKPDRLNRDSQGDFIIAFIELDDGLADQIDVSTVALILDGNTMLYAEPDHSRISDYNKNGILDLMVKFKKQAVLKMIGDGEVEISITGSVYGYFFQGTDTILVFK